MLPTESSEQIGSSVRYDPVTRTWKTVLDSNSTAGQPVSPNAGVNSPTSTSSESAAPAMSEETIVEHLTTYIAGKAEVLPDDLSYSQGRLYSVKGVGSQFSGKYYAQAVNVRVRPGRLSITLDLIRVNTDLAVENLTEKTIESTSRPERSVVPVSKQETYHVVATGETLSDVAKNHYGDASSWELIWNANKELLIKRDARNNDNPGWYVYPGQRLLIP